MGEIKISLKNNKSRFIEYIENFIKNNDEIIIVNIRTDKHIGDSLAPMVGSILQEKKYPLKIYGTISNPIHAVNMKEKFNTIRDKHPNAKILAIDAAVGSSEDIGNIYVKNKSIYPGKGVGKKLPPIGNISICGIIGESGRFSVNNPNIRLNFIYEMAKEISEILIEVLIHSKYNKIA